MDTPGPTTPAPGRQHVHTDTAGGIYGSLLAASVVVAAETSGEAPRLRLILLLLVTGVVFWVAHVYTRLAAERSAARAWNRHETRRVALDEWPLVQAALLPAAAVALSPLLGLDARGGAWFALLTALGQQVVWASIGAARGGASRGRRAAESTVHLLLGLTIVAAKVALKH